MPNAIQRVEESIEEIKRGKMVIMMDDEDRENEGDLVYAANFSTPQMVNFMASQAKGLICVSISKEIGERLQLQPMVVDNTSCHDTAFTISVDATEAKTGISAAERDMTIKILASKISKPSELVKPGHIFPLIAKDGGVLERTGHTEGSVDLCDLAGMNKAAVICEIMKEDGSMARKADLVEFAKKHDMKIVYVSDLVEYRLAKESLIEKIDEREIEFFGSTVKQIDFVDHEQKVHSALIFGKVEGITNVKFHNVGLDKDLLLNSYKTDYFFNAIEYLKQNSGVLVFLDRDDMIDDKMKEYGVGAQILHELGTSHINLIVSQKKSGFVGISGFGLTIDKEVVIES
ncbi:MAG: bifunctional 3,4-dihydroxy-2-butanone 4-phosphate synthase/GTP cyclohydrolase II [Campylobacterota bacterium]